MLLALFIRNEYTRTDQSVESIAELIEDKSSRSQCPSCHASCESLHSNRGWPFECMDTACYIKQKNYLWTLCIETSSSALWSASSTGWCPSCARAPRCNYFRSPEELRDATTFETSHGTSFLLKSTLLHNGHCLTSLSNTDLRPSGIVDTLQAIKWFFDYFFQNHSRNPFFRNYSVSFNYFFFPFSNINYFFFLVPPYKPVCDSSPSLYGSQCSLSTLQIRALLRTQTRIFLNRAFYFPL